MTSKLHDYRADCFTSRVLNIMRDRFWDPLSSDWNPERFYDSVVNKYFCPFPCE
jgi:hypothetical protein